MEREARMSKIKYIRVGKVKSYPNYRSLKLEIEKELQEGDTPRDEILSLSKWIDARLAELEVESK